MKQLTVNQDEFKRLAGIVSDAKPQDACLGTLKILLPKFPRDTHPNGRANWRNKAKAVRAQKETAWACAKQVIGLAKPWNAATVEVTYFTFRPMVDRDNILSWGKASFDALQGVVIANDSGFTYLPVKIERVKAKDPRCGCVQLVIARTA